MTFSIHGLAVARGIAIGRAVLVASSRVDVAHYFIQPGQVGAEIERVRQGRMQVADTQEGTFTISNLGMYGITEFTAVIHQPQTAILAVGAVRDNVLKVTLSLDHRVIDGVSAARFLATLKEYLENPCTMLI